MCWRELRRKMEQLRWARGPGRAQSGFSKTWEGAQGFTVIIKAFSGRLVRQWGVQDSLTVEATY